MGIAQCRKCGIIFKKVCKFGKVCDKCQILSEISRRAKNKQINHAKWGVRI